MRRTARRNAEVMETTDQPPSAEPLPIESESAEIPPREPPEGGFFFDRVAAITDAEWESRYVIYLYQTAPKISLPGDRHYIARLNSSFDESSVLANYGSGQYHVRLNDKKLRKTVATHLFSVYDPNKPPSIDPALIVDCPENEPFLKWKKKSSATSGSEDGANGASAVVAEIARDAMRKPKTDVTEGMLLGMAEGRDKLAEKLASMTAQPAATDPIQALDRAVELIQKLTANKQTAPAADPIQALDRAVDLLKKLQPAASIQKSPIDQVTEMLDLVKGLQQLVPAPVPAVLDSGQGTLAAVGAIVNALKDPITILTQTWAASRAPQGSFQSTAPGAAGQQAQPQPAASTAQAQPPGKLPESLAPLVNAISPLLLRWMQSEPDTPGEDLGRDLAQHTHENYGLEDLKSLQQLGADTIIDLYRRSPYWLTLAPMAVKFRSLVESFVDWTPPPRDDEEDPEVIDLNAREA